MNDFTQNFQIPKEVTDFRANHTQTTNLAWQMRSKEQGNERERERENRASVQRASQYSSLILCCPDGPSLLWSVYVSVMRSMTMSPACGPIMWPLLLPLIERALWRCSSHLHVTCTQLCTQSHAHSRLLNTHIQPQEISSHPWEMSFLSELTQICLKKKSKQASESK